MDREPGIHEETASGSEASRILRKNGCLDGASKTSKTVEELEHFRAADFADWFGLLVYLSTAILNAEYHHLQDRARYEMMR